MYSSGLLSLITSGKLFLYCKDHNVVYRVLRIGFLMKYCIVLVWPECNVLLFVWRSMLTLVDAVFSFYQKPLCTWSCFVQLFRVHALLNLMGKNLDCEVYLTSSF